MIKRRVQEVRGSTSVVVRIDGGDTVVLVYLGRGHSCKARCRVSRADSQAAIWPCLHLVHSLTRAVAVQCVKEVK